jgi:CDP-diacylglycerol--glycerol-3-phosphate 3-phosphatidyltransferase
MTFTDKLRSIFGNLLNRIGGILLKAGLTPDLITVIGMIGNCLAGYFIAQGQLRTGGWLVLLIGPLDALDGSLARLKGKPRPFGALLDSLADRVSEIAIMFGLLIYFLNQSSFPGCVLVFAALTGSVLVSYVRARAQSLGCDPKIGILTRVERYLVTSLCLLFQQPIIGLWILAVFTYVTVFQRVWFAWKELH